MKLSITEAAVASRCERQFLLARDGLRVSKGGDGARLGTPAHQILASFVARGRTHPLLAAALLREPVDEAALQHAVCEALYQELHDRAAALGPSLSAAELVRLGRITFDCAALLGELLVRARKGGLSGDVAFDAALPGSEEPVALSAEGLELEGVLDLCCRDLESGELLVFDLKTSGVDEASDQQARLYAEALQATPALACISGEGFTLRRVPRAPVAESLRSLRALLDGVKAPAAASPEICADCAVQRHCWSRWGRTLPEPAPAPTGSHLAADAKRLEHALRAHRVHLSPVDPALATEGPTLVRFRITLREGETISRVERCARDLQRTMGWPVPPLVSNDGLHVAIDAPRSDRETLAFSSLDLARLSGLTIPVGLAQDRKLLELDLAQAPHLLVAGATGSGKTVFLKGLLLSLLRLGREKCEVAIVDPKMLDFPPFDALPLARKVVTDAQEAVALLDWLAEEELLRRTSLLAKAGVTQRTELPEGALPAFVVVIDEFADLMLSLPSKSARDAFTGRVQRLLQRARAAGIHLVIATQRPSVDAIPGLLKANLPVRIAFKLPTAVDSTTVLDERGAENLLGRGDLLLKRDGLLLRAQAFNVTPDDVRAAQR
jgi:FtsK/SpoIIIE family/PD-(D/E)XK nuclease superfamily